MSARLVRRYARVACANLAPASVQTLADELGRAANLFAEQPLLREMLQNPQMRASLLSVVQPVLASLDMSKLAMRLLTALIDNRRAALLPEVVAEIGALATARAGHLQARVEAAEPLSEAQQKALRAALTQRLGADVSLQIQIDPDLLGGLRCCVGDFIFDTSLRGDLERLRDRLSQHGVGSP
jgi:F-type H+-transporting ATPase subunit delta